MNSSTRWIVPLDHPACVGHFPGTPILPGVVLLDRALHSIADALGITLEHCEISSVKFLSPVIPGDELEIQHRLSANGTLYFDIKVGQRKVASGSITPVTPP